MRGMRSGLGPKIRQLRTKFVEHGDESISGCSVGGFDLGRRAECFEDDVDRAIVQMQAASIGQETNLCAVLHGWPRFSGDMGHGFSARAGTCRRPSSGAIELKGRT